MTPDPSSPTPTATQAAVNTPQPTSTPEPSPRPTRATGERAPSSDRLALLTRCSGRTECYIYVIRRGDNLTSIANWFGVPYAAILSLNPAIRDHSLQPGDRVILPTPTR
jgi:spore germination protein YaaH